MDEVIRLLKEVKLLEKIEYLYYDKHTGELYDYSTPKSRDAARDAWGDKFYRNKIEKLYEEIKFKLLRLDYSDVSGLYTHASAVFDGENESGVITPQQHQLNH